MFHCNIILQVKLEIYEFDQIVYEVADLCTLFDIKLRTSYLHNSDAF
jgi:hypothetical protein